MIPADCGRGSRDSDVQVSVNPVEDLPMCSEIVDDRGAIRLDLLCNEDDSVKEMESDPSDPHAFARFNCI